MGRLILFLWLPLLVAAAVPDRYIVELTGDPVITRLTRGGSRRVDFHSTAARREREAVRAGQTTVRSEIARRGARILGSVDTVANALFIEAPEAQALAIERLPGVRRVRPVREFHLLLDRALPLHRVPEAWSAVGEGNAGRGIKIAIIDTGIDVTHPGFPDGSLPMPEGYPRVNQESDLALTNSKVIVARSYVSLLSRRDSDTSARDRIGHGTATAMAAAGASVAGPLAIISGVAPAAWLGSYKVFGSPGTNETTGSDAVIKAIEDAAADGMDVINLSLGSDLAGLLDSDLEVQAVERAARAGVLVITAAGNNGPDPNTISSPATAPSVITVGASVNDRAFSGSLTVTGLEPMLAQPGAGPNAPAPVNGPLADIGKLDGDGLACSALPSGSLTGAVAFILRGTCTFEEKLVNSERAGAIAAVVYSEASRPQPITMSVGAARLPATMISHGDGLRVREQLNADAVSATLRFTLGPVAVSSEQLGNFSAGGPSVDFAIKPDLVAVGTNLYTASQREDPDGLIFDPSGFVVEQGTSFSAPLVAGAAAVLKAARPGLSVAQYKSLLVNYGSPAFSRPGAFAAVQQAGAGSLNLSAALRGAVAASPVSLSFGATGPDPLVSRTLTISNTSGIAESYSISVVPATAGPVPEIASSTVELGPGLALDLPVAFRGTSLFAGQYEGSIYIQGNRSGSVIRVPYWYGVASSQPRYITVLQTRSDVQRGTSVFDAIIFRITDEAGIPVRDITPTITVVSGDGEVIDVFARSRLSPGAFGAQLRMGPRAGSNTFRIEAGGIQREVTIVAR
jgi:subtilisin family serine protease